MKKRSEYILLLQLGFAIGLRLCKLITSLNPRLKCSWQHRGAGERKGKCWLSWDGTRFPCNVSRKQQGGRQWKATGKWYNPPLDISQHLPPCAQHLQHLFTPCHTHIHSVCLLLLVVTAGLYKSDEESFGRWWATSRDQAEFQYFFLPLIPSSLHTLKPPPGQHATGADLRAPLLPPLVPPLRQLQHSLPPSYPCPDQTDISSQHTCWRHIPKAVFSYANLNTLDTHMPSHPQISRLMPFLTFRLSSSVPSCTFPSPVSFLLYSHLIFLNISLSSLQFSIFVSCIVSSFISSFFLISFHFLISYSRILKLQSILLCLSPSYSLTSSFYTLRPLSLCIKISLPSFSLSSSPAVSLLPSLPPLSLDALPPLCLLVLASARLL